MDENTIHSLLIDLELAGNGQPEGTSYAEELYETQILPAIDQTISQIGATNDLTIEEPMVIDLGEVEASDIAPLLSEQLSREIKRRIHPSAQTDSKPHKGPQSLPTRDDGAFAHFMDFLSNETVPWQYEVETFDAPEYLSKSLSDILRNENLCQQLLDSARNDKRVLWRLLSMASPTTLIRLHDAILPLGTTLTAHTAHNGETPKHGEVNHPQRGTLSKGDVSPSDKETLNHPAHQHIYSLLSQLAALMEQYGIASSESLDTLPERVREEQTKHTSPSGIRQGDKAESEADTASPSADGKSATEDATSTKRTSLPEQLAALMEQYGIASSESLNTLFERVKGEYATQIISAFGRGESKAKRAGMPSAPEKSGGTVQELLLSIERQSIAERQARPFPRRIHIDDAGLVLLHPFLTAYFTQLQLIDKEKQFKTIEDQKRAVHLLKHLSGDEAAHYSHRLALEKMMCGLPPDFPMEHEFQITEEEWQESEAMIASLCQYWRPLNGTSMAGLQHSFLLRHGTIEQSDDAWIVRVEGNAMDILLEDLPWEISTIVFPWMEPMILVEWQHN